MKGIIFDFNGTMVFDEPYHNKAWKHFSKVLRGYEMSDQEIRECVHGKVNEAIIAYLKPGLSISENKKMSLEKEAVYRNLCKEDKNYHLVDGLENLLDKLKEKHVPVNIASASIKKNIDFFVDVFHLSRWFDIENIRYDDGSYIDKCQMFKDAASAIGTSIEECIVFEDSISGIASAKKAGAKMIIAVADNEEKWLRYQNYDGISKVIKNYCDLCVEDDEHGEYRII